VAGLQRLIEQLPADVRAQLAWSPAEIRSAFAAFLDGPQDDVALQLLVKELLLQLRRIAFALSSLRSHPELLRSELESAWRADAALLRDYVDAGAGDAAECAIRGWISFIDFSLTTMRSGAAQQLAADLDDIGLDRPGSPLRVQALIMAAAEMIRRTEPPDEVAELLYRAFDEMQMLLLIARAEGIHLDPFRGETLAERAIRTRRYAAHLRNSLTDEDMHTLEESRLRALR